MSMEVEDHNVEVDLSNLIGINLNFSPLQLTLQRILKRLSDLEDQNAKKTEEIRALSDAVEQLRTERGVLKHRDGSNDCNGAGEHDAIWEAIDRLNGQLGELVTQERDRHTIDELYAARKRRDSHVSRASVSHSASRRPLSAHDAVAGTASCTPGLVEASAASGTSSPARHGSTASGRGSIAAALTVSEAESPSALGDKVLSKAHEPLPGLDETLRYAGNEGDDEEATDETGGGRGAGWPSAAETERAKRHSEEKTNIGISSTGGDAMQPPFSATEQVSREVAGSSGENAAARRRSTVVTSAGSGAATRRRSSIAPPSASVSDRLKRDGEDIAYLNRVVAEILGEMKGLHDNVDLLQTMRTGRDDSNGTDSSEALADATHRPRGLEQLVAQLQDALRHQQDDSSDLRERLEELRRATQPATRLSEENVVNVMALPTMDDRLRTLERAAAAASHANERLHEQLRSLANVGSGDGAEGVNAAAFAILQGIVASLEKQLADLQANSDTHGSNGGENNATMADDLAQLRDAVRRLQEETTTLEAAVDSNGRECARLETAKADKGDVLGAMADLRAELSRLSTNNGSGVISESRLDNLQGMVEDALRSITRLDDDKADRTALQRLREDLGDLKRLLELNAQRDAAAGRENGGSGGSGLDDALLRELQQQLMAQAERSSRDRDAADDDLERLRERVEQLDRRKADATLVANKAERDYVENALERLMREVEQVLNATNAGLIDTLDKSLNILRDMIDGKANRMDIQWLKQQMAADGTGRAGGGGAAAADGLTGFKGYRCLGCNRPVESLRPRSTAPKMNTFLNRNPQNFTQDNVTRSIQQQQHQGMYAGSTQSEPLPPIEGPR